MSEEDNIDYPFPFQQRDHFIEALFEEHVQNKEMFRETDDSQLKEPPLHQQNDLEQNNNGLFHIHLLEKEESNYMLPEKPFQEQYQEDSLGLKKKEEFHPNQPIKKQLKADKALYHEQTRQMKIERYRQKKHRRVWGRKIFYDCRKVVADNRERQYGRFVKKSPFITGIETTNKTYLATRDMQISKTQFQSQKIFQIEQLLLP